MRVINPYNFVSFGDDIGEQKKTREEAYRGDAPLLSGWLDVTLIPSTLLLIPDGAHPEYIDVRTKAIAHPSEEDKRQYHTKYDFMSRKDALGQKQYYIPGSSLRGMIRSVYEAATDSCVPFLLADSKKPISKRVPLYAALKKRGLLAYEYDKDKHGYVWRLYSTYAETEAVTVKEERTPELDWRGNPRLDNRGNPKTTSSFHFIKADGSAVTMPTGTNLKDGKVLQYNIPIDVTKEYHIAYLTKKECVHTWDVGDSEAYRLLNSVLLRDNVKGNQVHRNKKPAEDLKNALESAKNKKGNLVPVYYFTVIRKHEEYDEELVYLSNSSAGRIGQKRKWADIMADHGPCKGEKLCPACLLFGSLAKDHGLRSRVRITDALPVKGSLSEKDLSERTLDILGEPRTSAFEYYLERPEGASYWNFDFYGVNETDSNGVSHTKYYDMAEAQPRGRKMYWHGKEISTSKISKLNATMRGTKTPFRFQVYFDEISQEQLDGLVWVLTLGENTEDSQYQHKLGHAKPYGYGSVKLVVTGEHIRSLQKEKNGYCPVIEPKTVPVKPVAGIDLQKPYVQELLRMSDTKATDDTVVTYPAGQDGMIFTWFSENRLNADTVKTLPHPLDDEIGLESAIRNVRKTPQGRASYQVGDLVTAVISRPGISAGADRPYGFFVDLPGNVSALLHKKQMKKSVDDYWEGMTIQVKVSEINEDRGRKKYSVTDKF